MPRILSLISHGLSIIVVLGTVAMPALAQTAPMTLTPEMRAAMETCRPDVERLCPGVQPGDGRIMACMREHRREIGQPCRSALLTAAAAREDATGGGGR